MRKLFLLPLIGVLAAIGTLTIASAHSRPVILDPPPGAVLDAAPDKVEGSFTSELRKDENWTFIHVTDEQGNRVDTGTTELSSDRLHMSATLKPNLPDGRYLVTWRTYDDNDGAVFGDCYAFFVGQAAADAAISSKTRLDGGRDCQRIDVEAKEGTPVAGGTPQANAGDEGAPGGSSADDDGGIPTWGLIIGIIAGIVVGGAGVHLVGKRS